METCEGHPIALSHHRSHHLPGFQATNLIGYDTYMHVSGSNRSGYLLSLEGALRGALLQTGGRRPAMFGQRLLWLGRSVA